MTDFYVKGRDIVLKQADFDLDETLDCGQAFRWVKTGDDEYHGFFLNCELTISCLDRADGVFKLENTTEQELLTVWKSYFDLDADYGELKRRYSEDETLFKACGFAGGIRILRQDKWETLSSFILSQNNNIPRIKGIISRLCEHFGGYPDFTDMAGLTEQELGFLRAGFRAKYLTDAVEKLLSGEVSLEKAAEAELDEARAELMKIKGVGPKVADCTLLFSMHRLNAFPKDVWVKRVLEQWYPNGLPECTSGTEGVAQQYLFHYIRSL
ncbi:MAG: DNA-3-methyladenine glycosylase 2 family protein [Ruminococcus sp.]|nr:DNA-3-methyladenine glycosylase 2 family protein [Ruminococcus sp.]